MASQLDLVFVLDVTASMGSYIKSARDNIQAIIDKIVRAERAHVRFALVAYRDHPPQDRTFVTKTFDFTSSTDQMRKNLAGLSPSGGGDGPEAVTAALHATVDLDFRADATKICVLIADAPPHGLGGGNHDGFPKGDPNGLDPIVIARQMLKKGIVLYSVACEPSISNYAYARDFFAGVAAITEGTFLPLKSADMLADAIVGGASQEFSMGRLMDEVAIEAARIRREDPEAKINEEDLITEISKKMRANNVSLSSLNFEDIYGKWEQSNVEATYRSNTLAEAKKLWKPIDHSRPILGPSTPRDPTGFSFDFSSVSSSSRPSAMFSTSLSAKVTAAKTKRNRSRAASKKRSHRSKVVPAPTAAKLKVNRSGVALKTRKKHKASRFSFPVGVNMYLVPRSPETRVAPKFCTKCVGASRRVVRRCERGVCAQCCEAAGGCRTHVVRGGGGVIATRLRSRRHVAMKVTAARGSVIAKTTKAKKTRKVEAKVEAVTARSASRTTKRSSTKTSPAKRSPAKTSVKSKRKLSKGAMTDDPPAPAATLEKAGSEVFLVERTVSREAVSKLYRRAKARGRME